MKLGRIGFSILSVASVFSQAVVTAAAAAASVPSGNATITSWIQEQLAISWNTMLTSVNPAGAVTGFIAASLSTANPDYYYCWTRDAALVARVMTFMYNTTQAGDSGLLGILQDYVSFQIHAMGESTVCNCLGEPKFNPVNARPIPQTFYTYIYWFKLNDGLGWFELHWRMGPAPERWTCRAGVDVYQDCR